MVKNLPAMHEMRAQVLGQEALLEKEMTAHSDALAGKSKDRETWRVTVHGVTKQSDMT